MNPNDSLMGFIKSMEGSIIYVSNPNHDIMIRDMIIKGIEDNHYDVANIVADIDSCNRQIFRIIADRAFETGCVNFIYEDFDESYETIDDVEDSIYEWYFPNGEYDGGISAIENMVYETIRKYDLPVLLSKDQADEYPVFTRRFSNANGMIIDSLPSERDIKIHANHAQLLMFAELLDEGCASYGRQNVLMYPENEVKEQILLLGKG